MKKEYSSDKTLRRMACVVVVFVCLWAVFFITRAIYMPKYSDEECIICEKKLPSDDSTWVEFDGWYAHPECVISGIESLDVIYDSGSKEFILNPDIYGD